MKLVFPPQKMTEGPEKKSNWPLRTNGARVVKERLGVEQDE